MAQKRSRALNRVEIYCPTCGLRLWRMPGKKHFVYSTTVEQARELLGLTKKTATLLHAATTTLVDRTRWIEEFFCPNDGAAWIACHRDKSGQVTGQVATGEQWQQTTGTVDPRRPNPSVGEFTYRNSRGIGLPTHQ
ncbi:MAG: hypothetical protein KME03_02860 [Aphanocapsa lilacina HA4352-LM1]|jgi:hypothetical protein|nr:hypothetical protein [Aphanocapsa lilacina HA4352-LM1]